MLAANSKYYTISMLLIHEALQQQQIMGKPN